MISLVFIALFLLYWVFISLNTPEIRYDLPLQSSNTRTSIIIAFRDEENHIPDLLLALDNQMQIDKAKTQIIFVNDRSIDQSVELIEQWKQHNAYQVKLLHLREGHGKKMAIRLGVSQAYYSVLLFTDADCIPNPYWIHQMSTSLEKQNAQLLIGSVWFLSNRSLFQGLQKLEFSVLQAVTAFATHNKFPFMCNGANLAVQKTEYLAFLNETEHLNMVSGDDVFLLDYMLKNNKKIEYAKHQTAVVETFPNKNLSEFINQRLRWSSKVKYYRNLMMLGCSVFFSIWSLLLPILLGFYFLSATPLLLILIGIKLGIDLTIVNKYHKAYTEEFSLLNFIILIFLYPIYVIGIGILSLFKSFTWKNRKATA